MGIKIFTTQRLLNEQYSTGINIEAIIEDFRQYKTGGVLPDTFGRDEPYDRPASALAAELRHIHLDFKASWNLRKVQYNRTSDAALIYCQGWHSQDNYLLLALLESEAHKRTRKVTFMAELAEIAEKFREKK